MSLYYEVKYTSYSLLSYLNFRETRICMNIELLYVLYFLNIKFQIETQMLHVIVNSL